MELVPSTLGGLAVILPYPVAAYRGWVGGIVSVNADHVSRLLDPSSAMYYIAVIILQILPYSLAGGAGVNMGIAYFRPKPFYTGKKWFGIPVEAIKDAAKIYVLVIPLFLLASLVEFLT